MSDHAEALVPDVRGGMVWVIGLAPAGVALLAAVVLNRYIAWDHLGVWPSSAMLLGAIALASSSSFLFAYLRSKVDHSAGLSAAGFAPHFLWRHGARAAAVVSLSGYGLALVIMVASVFM